MQITDVRVKLCGENSEQLRAFCSITLDGYFVVRDLKVIDGTTGLFVAMPSRKLADRCPKCRHKNHLRARFCNECGARLRENRAGRGTEGRSKLYVDVAHPINSDCRKLVQETVIEAYRVERERSHEPGYVPQEYEEDDLNESSDYDDLIRELKSDAIQRHTGASPSAGGTPEESDYAFAVEDDLAVEPPSQPPPRAARPDRRNDRQADRNHPPRGPHVEEERGAHSDERDRRVSRSSAPAALPSGPSPVEPPVLEPAPRHEVPDDFGAGIV